MLLSGIMLNVIVQNVAILSVLVPTEHFNVE